MFWIMGFVFLHFGSTEIVHKPTEAEEREILDNKKKARKIERMEMSINDDDGGNLYEEDIFEKEENVNIRRALDWKRRHFFVQCFLVGIVLMLKLEYSYSKIFAQNITIFLMIFMVSDIIFEQLLVRIIMSEALLVAPLLGSFVITEFIMTMGAADFRAFIISYFIETSIIVVSRTYIGPFVEKLEALAQITVIKLAKKYKWARDIFGTVLVRQLAGQLQLMSLNEYTAKKQKRKDDDANYQGHQFEW